MAAAFGHAVARAAVARRGRLRAAAVLIGVNWFLYVWAVTSGLVLQTSLGYFITPLVSVVFGVAMFGERLRPLQWAAVAVAAAGMVFMAFSVGGIPWVSLGLATSFGAYSIVKKQAPLSAVEGLTLETAILWLPAVASSSGCWPGGAPACSCALDAGDGRCCWSWAGWSPSCRCCCSRRRCG